MQIGKIFFVVLLVFICINIAAVSASDLNSTESLEINTNESFELNAQDTAVEDNVVADENESVEKSTPDISISSNNVKSKDTLEISLENSTGNPLK